MHIHRDTSRWAEQIFGRCELGDARRTRRTVKLGAQLAAHAGQAPVSAWRGDSAANEGAYRLLRNEAVAPEAIAEGGFQATAQAARGCGELLAVEDTTTLSYGHGAAAQLGDLGGPLGSTTRRGYIVHTVLLVEAHSAWTVGLIEQSRWCRSSAERGQRHRHARWAYEDKESFKWQRASERVTQRLGEETMGRASSRSATARPTSMSICATSARPVSDATERRARAPCSEVLTHTEWRVLWVAQERSRPPAKAPPLQWAYKTLANLGGWMDTKRTGRAGWEAMWQGWFRLQERVDTYLAARDFLDEPEM
jgi:Transposase DNA-binding